MSNYLFKKAIKSDIGEVLGLIQKRIAWMDANNINQWNKTNYLEAYPEKYFEGLVLKGNLFVMKDEMSGKVLGAVALLNEDKRWNKDSQSYYIHNLVTDTEISGIGAEIINSCETLSINNGKNKMRLDCQFSNHKLNQYYNEHGFQFVGTIQEGNYIGNKREKRINL
jgi:hypothetical protein